MQNDPTIPALSEQVGCYRKLAKLAEAQHGFVQNSQTERLLEVLQLRERLLAQLAELEKVIAPAKKAWTEYLTGLEPAARKEAEALLSETKSLLAKITAADRDDVMVLQQRKLNVGRLIRQATTAMQVNRNYAASAYGRAAPRMNVQS